MPWATQRQIVAIDFNSEMDLSPNEVAIWVTDAINYWGGWPSRTHLVHVSPLTVERQTLDVIKDAS